MKIYIIEDNPDDILILTEELSYICENCDGEQLSIESESNFDNVLSTLKNRLDFDIIFLDLNIPPSYGIETLNKIVKLAIKTPVIVITGENKEELGKEAIKKGAQDYLVKGTIEGRTLKKTILFAIERFKILKEKENLIKDLIYAYEQIKQLQGIIPICATCKKIRDDDGYWQQVEQYIGEHSGAKFSHGMCPDCYQTFKGELEEYKKNNKK